MNASPNINKRHQRHLEIDARVGDALIEVKFGVDALRTIRTSLMQVAYPVGENPATHGYIVLVDSPITTDRLQDEWERAVTILRQDVLNRLTICVQSEGRMKGIPRDPDIETQRMLSKVIATERGRMNTTRTDYSFVVQSCCSTNGSLPVNLSLQNGWPVQPAAPTPRWLG